MLFRLNLVDAVVADVPLPACYPGSGSSLRLRRVAPALRGDDREPLRPPAAGQIFRRRRGISGSVKLAAAMAMIAAAAGLAGWQWIGRCAASAPRRGGGRRDLPAARPGPSRRRRPLRRPQGPPGSPSPAGARPAECRRRRRSRTASPASKAPPWWAAALLIAACHGALYARRRSPDEPGQPRLCLLVGAAGRERVRLSDG